MNDRSRDDLRKLLAEFMDSSAADAAEREIRAGERLLDAYPAPPVTPASLAAIKRQIAIQLASARRPSRPLYRYVGAAAAVILVALIGFFGRPAQEHSATNYASLIPTAIWESDDLASDDMQLAYFHSELRDIETQMQAIEAGDGDLVATASLDEVEIELARIDRQFWKE
jgi:hypothetical protein